MCGIFGFVTTKPSLLNSRIMYILGSENNHRGPDSTGIAEIGFDIPVMYNEKQKFKFKCFKNTVAFAEIKKHINNYSFLNKNIVIGHVRKASSGTIDNKNIHPHIVGNTILAHNGTIVNLEEIKDITKQDWDNDSKHLAKLIDMQGHIKPAVGAATMVWFNSKNKNVNISKFEREMYIFASEDILVFSSDFQGVNKVNQFLFLEKLKQIALIDHEVLTININSETQKIETSIKKEDWFVKAPANNIVYSNHVYDDDYTIYDRRGVHTNQNRSANHKDYKNPDLLHDYYNGAV